MIEAYDGDEPFLFVSYAHADSDEVFREIDRLHQRGVRIWYDEGIEAGNDWPAEIGRALAESALFVVFISPNSVASKNVQNEINFALNRSKSFLAVHLVETQLPVGLELRMGDIQALMKYSMKEDHYYRKLDRRLPQEVIQASQPQAPTAAQTPIPRKQVVVPPPSDGQATRAVSLQFRTKRGERNVCLCAGDSARLGRDRVNDFVLRVLPRSAGNDQLSLQISGQHAKLQIEESRVVWRNEDCSNGTIIDRRNIGASEELTVSPGTPIRPAGVLPLTLDVFDGSHFDTPADFSAVDSFAASASPSPMVPGPINSVGIRRGDDLKGCESYVLVHRGALLGRGPTCAVRIDDPSLSNRHARIYTLHGGLWIEPADASSIVLVDGRRLAVDELAALTPDSVLTCGTLKINVTGRFQHSLGDVDRTAPLDTR